MPGDEVHEGEGASTDAAPGVRVRTGPRHAAPRKPLLTRLHVPAGKAIAIAAMPSAVLMGMGLTPQLANAKPQPKNPFKGDSCVSVADQKETEAEKEERKERAEKLKRDLARERAERQKAAQDKQDQQDKTERKPDKPAGDGTGEGSETESPKSPAPSGGSEDDSDSGDSPQKPSSGSGSGDSSSSEDEENPWYDPLGVGKTLDEALKPKKPEEPEAPEAPADETPDAPSDGEKPTPEPTPSTPETPEKDAKPDTSGSEKSEADRSEKAGKSGKADEPEAGTEADKDEKSKKSKDSGSGNGVSKKDGTARDYDAAKDSGKPFPCPEKMKVKGTDEQTPAQVPNQPWYLKASSLTLKGLDYQGVVNITMPNGRTKQALKFTADALDIGDLHQTVKGPQGRTYHVQGAKGSTSTIRGGKVTMYTEELKGNLFGLVPITFSPESPPPINLPYASFTDVTVKQAGQFGGNLTIPGLHQHMTK